MRSNFVWDIVIILVWKACCAFLCFHCGDHRGTLKAFIFLPLLPCLHPELSFTTFSSTLTELGFFTTFSLALGFTYPFLDSCFSVFELPLGGSPFNLHRHCWSRRVGWVNWMNRVRLWVWFWLNFKVAWTWIISFPIPFS